MTEENKSIIEMPKYFDVLTGKYSETIKRLGDFDKPNKLILEKAGLDALSFNFFVRWGEGYSDGTLVQEFWIKRIISLHNKSTIGVDDIINSDVAEKLKELEGKNHIISAVKSMESINVRLRYLMIINNPYPSKLPDKKFIGFFMDYLPNEDSFNYEYLSIKKLIRYIKFYTGKPLKIGKGLNLAETYLEAYLSKTDTPFPGDCDELIFSINGIEALIEYKKCTKKDKIQVAHQSFKRFLQSKDRLKYTRLNILRKYLNESTGRDVPFVNVLYSVEENDRNIKLEIIEVSLNIGDTLIFEVNESPVENKQRLLNSIMGMVRQIGKNENADK